jgi:hypothetical protein
MVMGGEQSMTAAPRATSGTNPALIMLRHLLSTSWLYAVNCRRRWCQVVCTRQVHGALTVQFWPLVERKVMYRNLPVPAAFWV